MMKVGDKVLCKENLFLNRVNGYELVFIKGAWYELVRIDVHNNMCIVYSKVLHLNVEFYLINKSNAINKFDVFFMSSNDIRRSKLQKLSEV